MAAASLVSSLTLPLLSAILGGAIALVFLAGYLRRKRAAIAHIPPSATATAASPDQPKHVRPSNQAQHKKGHLPLSLSSRNSYPRSCHPQNYFCVSTTDEMMREHCNCKLSIAPVRTPV
uniref:Uncharacterized protein n=1 Tax=Arundo donax TaxID=35708 RepID=A0A0A9DAE4_ARUDO